MVKGWVSDPLHYNGVEALQATRAKLGFLNSRIGPHFRGKQWALENQYDPLEEEARLLIDIAKKHCVDAVMSVSYNDPDAAFVHTFMAWKLTVIGLTWTRYRAAWRKEKRFFRRHINDVDRWLANEWRDNRLITSEKSEDDLSSLPVESTDETAEVPI